MKTIAQLSHRFSWINPAAAALITLLQRSPAVRLIVATDELVAVSPIGAVLKSALAAVATLGAYDTLAGATVLSTTQPTPLSATVGIPITSVGITVTNTINIGSWRVTGSLPPGLMLSAVEGGNTLTGPGLLDATTPGVPDGYGGTTGGNTATTPVLSGTPTTAGSYTFNLTAYEFGAATGLVSNTFPYTVVVAAANTAIAPSFTTQPQNQTVIAGNGVTFTAAASGSPTPTYQWNFNGAPISGATSATYSIASAQSSNAGSYTVTATNSAGSATSAASVLTVNPVVISTAPVFTTQPIAVSVVSGSTVALTVAASSTLAPSYQWAKDGTAIPGATRPTLVLNGATTANAGNYTCTATNSGGSTVSTAAALSITSTTDVGRLTSLSTRAVVGTGDNVLIAGFIVGGAGTTGTKPMLMRGTGPALTGLGVAGVLPDPTLTLYQGSTVAAFNDNWGGDSQISAEDATSGAFLQSSLDSALYMSNVAPGIYSAKVAGNNNGTGVALAEIYDLTASGSYTLTTPRLTGISARSQVGTGGDVLIAGFVIGGSSARTVLIRASGPALGQFGLAGLLPDPLLTLYDHNSAPIISNQGWAGDPQIASAAAAVYDFPWLSATSNDSALLVTLPPGLYSAIISGASGDTGVALVEVYEVP